MILLTLLLLPLVAMAQTEMYFEFDRRATVSTSDPATRFCLAATTVLTPTANVTAWCNQGTAVFKYTSHYVHGTLSNVRIYTPVAPVAWFRKNETIRHLLSDELLSRGFFYAPANVTDITDYTFDQVLNSILTSVMFVLLFIMTFYTSCVRDRGYAVVPETEMMITT